MVNTLIFDFGGVLYDISHSKTIKAFYALSSENSIFRTMDKSHYSNIQFLLDYEMGLIDNNTFRNKLREMLNSQASDTELDNAWNATLLGLYADTINIISSLASQYDIYLLSNTNSIHFEYFSKECNELFSYFKKLYLSYELKMRKPNKEIFKFVMDDLNKEPQSIVFIDDLIENINSAQSCGMNVFHINNEKKLSDFLHTVSTYTQLF